MKLNSKVKRLIGLSMMMLVVGMVMVTPTLACPAGTNCDNSSGGNAGKPIELSSEEKDKLINKALENNKFVELQDYLENEGFKQKDIEAYVIPVTLKDNSVVDVQIVTSHFESPNKDAKYVAYVHNTKTDEIVVATGVWSCAECLAVLTASGLGCFSCCVTAGVLTIGTACVICAVAAYVVALCPCYKCFCAAGWSTACDAARKLDC